MNLFATFEAGLPLADFLAKYGTDAHRARWQSAAEQTALTDAQRALLGTFTRRTNVLVLAGAWCGDCSSQCPIFERIAEAAPVVVTRYLDRDAHADVQAALQVNGGNRVPVAVFFSEDGHEVARYGERTLARMPGHPWTTFAFIAVAVGIVANSFIAYPMQSLTGSAILAAATVAFFLSRRPAVEP